MRYLTGWFAAAALAGPSVPAFAADPLELGGRELGLQEPAGTAFVESFQETAPGSGRTYFRREIVPWREVAGRTIQVEGLADGEPHDKGSGPDVLFREGSLDVSLSAEDEKRWRNGRPVRIVGVLMRRVEPAPKPPAPPPGHVFSPDLDVPFPQRSFGGIRYWIRPTHIEFVDRVEYPFVRIPPER